MPQRALDVMASGGFLLSNYQPELVEYFSYGEDMVVYESMEDAVEKCRFYLENDDLRKEIAQRGRRRVLEEHNLPNKVREMMRTAGIIQSWESADGGINVFNFYKYHLRKLVLVKML